MQVSLNNSDLGRLQTPDTSKARFVTADYRMPDAARTSVRITVGLSKEGGLIIRVPARMRKALDDRHIVLIGLALARGRLQAKTDAVRSVLIQVQGE